MEGMTNQQFDQVLKMIIQIIKDSKDKEDAIKKNRRTTKEVDLLTN